MPVEILGPDGVLGVDLVFSSTSQNRFFEAVGTPDVLDVEVKVGGQPWSSSPDLCFYRDGRILIPNPSDYPDGLPMFSGENVVQIRGRTSRGTTPAARVRVILQSTSGRLGLPPTGISVNRGPGWVDLEWRESPSAVSYNLYAASSKGGLLGYRKVNAFPISTGTMREQSTPLSSLPVRFRRASGSPSLDISVAQTEEGGSVVSTHASESSPIPDGVEEVSVSINVFAIDRYNSFSFRHDRLGDSSSASPTISNNEFSSLSAKDPLFYVVTAVYFDATTSTEYESPHYVEVVASPVQIRRTARGLPPVPRQNFVNSLSLGVSKRDPQLAIHPGSTTRDTFIDPASSELSRVSLLVDFGFRCGSFDTLLQVDDPAGSGTSSDPASSPYKVALAQALFLSNVQDVQAVIDRAFDVLASRSGVYRDGGKRSGGEVIFYTTSRPTRTLAVPLGWTISGSGQPFRTLSAAEISLSSLASCYNPMAGRWQVSVFVEAVAEGPDGNVGAGAVNSGAPPGLSVTNPSPMAGGLLSKSNLELATEAQNRISSVDSGTEAGIMDQVSRVPGVLECSIVSSGSPLMHRDWYPPRHVGGMCDVWVSGRVTSEVADTFALAWDRATDVRFYQVGEASLLEFRSAHESLSPERPIRSLIDRPLLGLGLRNARSGLMFNLAGVEILDWRTIRLSSSVAQPSFSLVDPILGDYLYGAPPRHVFSRQPVVSVVSVFGEVSGEVSGTSLIRTSSPLLLGGSVLAGDYLSLPPGMSATPIPAEETHVLVSSSPSFLRKLGGDEATVVVSPVEGGTAWRGPYDPSGADYSFVEMGGGKLGVVRTRSSRIPDGAEVSVSYEHSENLSVLYEADTTTSLAQKRVDGFSHVASQILVKQKVHTPVDLRVTVVTEKGVSPSDLDSSIRLSLEALFYKKRGDVWLRRSDVEAAIENTSGVSYIPSISRMSRSPGSQVPLEDLGSPKGTEAMRIIQWSTEEATVWLLSKSLSSATEDGGGDETLPRGVWEDQTPLSLQTVLPEAIGGAPGQAFVVGKNGVSIPSFSDDSTLSAQGYATAESRVARRKELTGNRVLLSLPVGDDPTSHSYLVAYVTVEDPSVFDIHAIELEVLIPGTFEFIYQEDV